MASATGQTADHLIDEIAGRPFTFDFYRVVRLLENEFRSLPYTTPSVFISLGRNRNHRAHTWFAAQPGQ